MENLSELYTPKTAAKIIGVDPELLKTWSNEFNIQTQRTEGGHRRYSKTNIEELKSIREKLHNQNWSYDQIRSWRNGEIDLFIEKEETSNLEKKMDKLLEYSKNQEEFNQALVQQITVMTQRMEKMESENRTLKTYFGDRDKMLMDGVRQIMDSKQEAQRLEEENREQKRSKRFGLFKLKFWD